MKWTATILFALAATLARADYPAGTTDSDLLRSGTPVVTNAWLAVSNDTARLIAGAKNDASRITDGTNTIDAARNVWQSYSGRVCTNANEAWTYVVGGVTYTASQMADLFGAGDESFSRTLTWVAGNFIDWQGETTEFEGWYVQDGSGTAPVGYNFFTGEIPDYATDRFLAEVSYNTEPVIKAYRGTFAIGTNYVGRLALTNDIPSVVDADLTPATNYANKVGALVANEATNYTEAVAQGFEDGLRSPQYAINSGHADYAVELYDETATATYNATDLIRESTNAAVAVADAKISTNNPAFVAAVTNCPVVIASGGGGGDGFPAGDWSNYGTLGALLAAFAAAITWLRNKANATDTALAGKANVADLPYRLVEPGVWEFSDGLSHEISGPNEVIDPGEEAASFWVYSSSYNGVAYYSQHFETESLALETLAITFSHIGDSFTATRASLPGHLLDRAGNRVVVSGATTLTLPALEHAGKARDFLVKVTTSADDLNITWQGQGSEAPNGADELQFVTEDGDFPVVGTAGDYLFSFTEVEAHTFAVSMKPIVAAPQAQGGS